MSEKTAGARQLAMALKSGVTKKLTRSKLVKALRAKLGKGVKAGKKAYKKARRPKGTALQRFIRSRSAPKKRFRLRR